MLIPDGSTYPSYELFLPAVSEDHGLSIINTPTKSSQSIVSAYRVDDQCGREVYTTASTAASYNDLIDCQIVPASSVSMKITASDPISHQQILSAGTVLVQYILFTGVSNVTTT